MSSFYPVIPSVALPGVAFGLLTLAEGALPARHGDQVIVYRPVLAGTLRAYDNGDLALSGRAADHVSLGAAEAELDRRLGPDALDRLIAEAFAQFQAMTPPGSDNAAPDDAVRGQETALALTRGVVVRALVLGSWMAGTGWDDVLAALFAPVADVPFTRCPATPGGPAFSRARRGVPGVVVAAVCEAVLAVLRAELLDPHDPQALTAGAFRVAGFDGTLLRLPDTAANRERFGAGTDPAPFPHVRLLIDVDAGTKTPLGYAHGPSSGAKDTGEQTLLEQVATATPAICHPGLLHVGDRNVPGAERLARLTGAGMNLAVRLRAGITVDVDTWLPDGSALVDLGTDDVLHGWRDVEWDVFADGRPHR
ncbi:hypothetical protein [Frankia sp. CiP3]|uniref:hypothetical protein n=1 Tax=Frankia sp. CiP3 TaxID=2880971 RepID=UPI001EF3EDD2|nr:hypothetical protein [Frankia sp. CiP3]